DRLYFVDRAKENDVMTVRLDLHKESEAILRAPLMLPDRSNAYLRATEGSVYDWKLHARTAWLPTVPEILRRLRDASFDVEISSPLRLALEKQTARDWKDLKATEERIDHLSRDIASRTGASVRPEQRFGAEWLSQRKAALLADEMRLGK